MTSNATVSHNTDSNAQIDWIGDTHLVHEHQDSIRDSHLQASGRGLFLALLYFKYWSPGKIFDKQRSYGHSRSHGFSLERLGYPSGEHIYPKIVFPRQVVDYIVKSLKSDSLNVALKRKMRFRWSVNNRNWFSLSRKCRSWSSDSMIGNTSLSMKLQRRWVALNDPLKNAKGSCPDNARWPSAASLEPELRLFPNESHLHV